MQASKFWNRFGFLMAWSHMFFPEQIFGHLYLVLLSEEVYFKEKMIKSGILPGLTRRNIDFVQEFHEAYQGIKKKLNKQASVTDRMKFPMSSSSCGNAHFCAYRLSKPATYSHLVIRELRAKYMISQEALMGKYNVIQDFEIFISPKYK